MTLGPKVPAFAANMAKLVLVLAAVTVLSASGCSREDGPSGPATPAPPGSGNEVVGTLIAKQDDRPVDGGIDLTIETAPGTLELVRVPSIFIVPPRDAVRAMHEVVDAAKLGDRIRARGTRDEEGALRAETLELIGR